ncbi:MAG: ribonuclease M5 [Bacilli bacterium]|jgi:ribonuclease M5
MKIKEVIIVEGKHDITKLQSFLKADIIKTDGTALPLETKITIKQLQKAGREFIVLTDPDYPGTKIRNEILKIIPDAKQAFLDKEEAKTAKKIGVEHASKETIMRALNGCISYQNKRENLRWEDFFGLGLNGNKNSALLRKRLGKNLNIGYCNAKTFYKRLNMLKLTKQELSQKIEAITNE